MANETAKSEKSLGYEEVIRRLEEVVKRLEAGNLPLEDSLKAFEEGISLVRMGEARLNEAEKRVEELLAPSQADNCASHNPESPQMGKDAPFYR